jgi:hypothetical protein
MYAETSLAFRFMQSSSSPEIHQFEDLFKSYKLSDEMVCLFDFTSSFFVTAFDFFDFGFLVSA